MNPFPLFDDHKFGDDMAGSKDDVQSFAVVR
jgi:hypothetical protein